MAFRSPPKDLAPARERAHDIALRLEQNRWNGMVEPRVILRALCPTEPGEIELLGEKPFWEELRDRFDVRVRCGPPPSGGMVEDRRREGFAGVAGDLISSGEAVLVAVADVPRRKAGLEAVVAGLSNGPMPVVSWAALAARPELADGFDHLVALDPPPGGIADPLLGATPRAHLAWGQAEAEFAMAAYRSALDLRPQLTEVYRALRDLPENARQAKFETAIRGTARYPRPAPACARLLKVLTELGLVELDLGAPTCRVVAAVRSDLEHSPTYREACEQLAATENALVPELPRAVPAAATG